jgi:hypothetical protein
MFRFYLKINWGGREINRREKGEEGEKKMKGERDYIKFTGQFGQAIISAIAKANRPFFESYQTLLYLTTNTMCTKSKVYPSTRKIKSCLSDF